MAPSYINFTLNIIAWEWGGGPRVIIIKSRILVNEKKGFRPFINLNRAVINTLLC